MDSFQRFDPFLDSFVRLILNTMLYCRSFTKDLTLVNTEHNVSAHIVNRQKKISMGIRWLILGNSGTVTFTKV
jgi:hypothetical protein